MNGIELQGVQAKIGTFELKGIDLVVPKGSVLGLLGRNGAGKTTLFKTMNGTYLKQDGLLKIYGKTFEEDEEGIRMNLSIVYDTYNINPLTKGKKLLKYDRIWFPGFDDRLFEQLKKTFIGDAEEMVVVVSVGQATESPVARRTDDRNRSHGSRGHVPRDSIVYGKRRPYARHFEPLRRRR